MRQPEKNTKKEYMAFWRVSYGIEQMNSNIHTKAYYNFMDGFPLNSLHLRVLRLVLVLVERCLADHETPRRKFARWQIVLTFC